jgi:hypothetical protein
VLAYKGLSQVERAFRSLKTTDLDIRPIHHRRARRVRGHVLLCMLAYYVTWHMQQAPMLFTDHDKQTAALQRSSPVAAARVSPAARAKAATKRTAHGQPVHRFATLLAELRQRPTADRARGAGRAVQRVSELVPAHRM